MIGVVLPVIVFCGGGDGVLVGVRKDITVYLVQITRLNVEHIFVRFSIGCLRFVVGIVYTPPRPSLRIYEPHVSSVVFLSQRYTEHIFIICGNYNLPKASWNNEDDGLIYSSYFSIPSMHIYFHK